MNKNRTSPEGGKKMISRNMLCRCSALIASLGLAALFMSVTPSIVHAQGEAVSAAVPVKKPEFDKALQRGNKAYNGEKYADAIAAYTQAIQISPQRPEPYKNMARAYFWKGTYDAALAYYDTYITSFPGADDIDQIQRERRLTSDRTSKPWSLPETQRLAMRSLEAALSGDEIYARGGAGAWQSYQALLRTGYAQPELATLRLRLFEQMLAEHDRRLAVEPGQTAPVLDEQDWALQQERMKAAGRLVAFESQRDEIARRTLIHDAAEALLLSRYEDAAAASEKAIAQNPDELYLRWFYITALMRANKTKRALDKLDQMEQLVRDRDPAQIEYVDVMRAMLLQRLDRHDEAAQIYTSIFMAD